MLKLKEKGTPLRGAPPDFLLLASSWGGEVVGRRLVERPCSGKALAVSIGPAFQRASQLSNGGAHRKLPASINAQLAAASAPHTAAASAFLQAIIRLHGIIQGLALSLGIVAAVFMLLKCPLSVHPSVFILCCLPYAALLSEFCLECALTWAEIVAGRLRSHGSSVRGHRLKPPEHALVPA